MITLNSHAQNDRQGTHRLRILRLRKTLYCRAQPEKNILTGIVELTEIDERVRMLCAKAAHARESEAEEILAELRQALKEHARFVRMMAGQTLTRLKKEPSSSRDAA